MYRTILTLAVTVIVVAAALAGVPRPIVLQVDQVPVAWSDGRLGEKMITALTRDPELRVIMPQKSNGALRPLPADRTNLDSLLIWGVEAGGRYLLTINVTREDLEQRKTFSVPLLFHRWETFAVIAGEMRLLDLQKRRVVIAEPFEEKLSAVRQFQGSPDDNAHDPSLHIEAGEKKVLFDALETRLTERLVKRIGRLTRGY